MKNFCPNYGCLVFDVDCCVDIFLVCQWDGGCVVVAVVVVVANERD